MEICTKFVPAPEHNVLVTGGAGHVGSGLIQELVRLGYKNVTSLDNYSNGSKDNHIAGCHYIDADTRHIFKVLPVNDFDVIFHLGEFARVEQSFDNLADVYASNYQGTLAMLEFAMSGDSKFIYSCSSAINSMTDPDIVNSPYVITKRANRDMINSYFKLGKLRGAIAYFSNVFGGNERGIGGNATVVAKFLNAKKNGKEVVIHAPGTQTRKFTHIDDLVQGVLLVCQYGVGDGYFIASKNAISIRDLAKKMEVPFRLVPSGPGNRKGSDIDHSAMDDLGWSAKITIEDYVETACSMEAVAGQ